MAIFRPGPPVGAISGNLGGANFVLGNYGPYIRARRRPTNKRTKNQLKARARFQYVTQAWADQLPEDRLTWNRAATALRRKNRMGTPKIMSGYMLFVEHNLGHLDVTTIAPFPPKYLLHTNPPEDLKLFASAAGAIWMTWIANTPPVETEVFIWGDRSLSDRPAHFFNQWAHVVNTRTLPGARGTTITSPWDKALGHPIQGELISAMVVFVHTNYLRSFAVQATATVAA